MSNVEKSHSKGMGAGKTGPYDEREIAIVLKFIKENPEPSVTLYQRWYKKTQGRRLPFNSTEAYNLLKYATERYTRH